MPKHDKARDLEPDGARSKLRWSPARGLGELVSFLLAGATAILQFWLPKRFQEPTPELDVVEEAPDEADDALLSDRLEAAVKKVAPYPAQEG